MQYRVEDDILMKFLSGHKIGGKGMTTLYTEYGANSRPVREAMIDLHYFNDLRRMGLL